MAFFVAAGLLLVSLAVAQAVRPRDLPLVPAA
jgi:hypothetical protein